MPRAAGLDLLAIMAIEQEGLLSCWFDKRVAHGLGRIGPVPFPLNPEKEIHPSWPSPVISKSLPDARLVLPERLAHGFSGLVVTHNAAYVADERSSLVNIPPGTHEQFERNNFPEVLDAGCASRVIGITFGEEHAKGVLAFPLEAFL